MVHISDAQTSDRGDGSDTVVSLADKYRPERFEDVFGQDYPVRYLSRLVQRDIGRNLLLHGTVGSGKTSLVRLYAKALNCRKRMISGSPCGTCDQCQMQNRRDAGLYEYDVSSKIGQAGSIKSVLDELNRTPYDYKYRILFFDEAHNLTNEAADLLLKAVEEPAKGVLFCFATTEFSQMRRALRSRLDHLEVRALPAPLAIRFLQQRADEEGIRCEPEALSLLAGLKEGYPRDLLVGLEQVHDPDVGIVTLEHVRTVFDVDHTRILVDYFVALAEGDLARQTALMVSWREPAGEKVRWLQAFLTSLYFNDILFLNATVDAVIHSITARERAPIIASFCERLGVKEPAGLVPYWRSMMNFWKDAAADFDEAAIMLRLAVFHDFINHDLPRLDPLTGQALAPASTREVAPASVVVPSAGFGQELEAGSNAGLSKAGDDADAKPGFFSAADAREVINRASFLTQEYGLLFNAAFEVNPVLFGASTEAECVTLVQDLCADLSRQVKMWNLGGIFAHLTVYERDENGVRALVVAHLPRPEGQARGIDCVDRAAAWMRHWRREHRLWTSPSAIGFEEGPEKADKALSFHWRKTLELCAGLGEAVEDRDPCIGYRVPLYSLLRIPHLREAGPILDHSLIHASDNLQSEAIAAASVNRMEPLSAFDAKAWDEIQSGWEQQEYFDRHATKQEREAELAEFHQMYDVSTAEGQRALDRLIAGWPVKPEQRRRSWNGWWRQSEV